MTAGSVGLPPTGPWPARHRHAEPTEPARALLLHKLELPHPFQWLENGDSWIDGKRASYPDVQLVLRCEEDEKHYGARGFPPGQVSPDAEAFIAGSAG